MNSPSRAGTVPLIERARNVPRDGRCWYENDPCSHQNVPYGHLIHGLADRAEALERECIRLFSLLDDVDTAEDQFKPDQTPYFNHVHKLHRKRFKGICTTDGLTITIPEAL